MFDGVIGHERQKQMLKNIVAKEQFPRAMCFFGPDGIGKLMLARQVARALLCETQNNCGTCRHCQKIDKQIHPDYQELEPQGTDIKVDQVRQISSNLHYRPFEASRRIILIDRAECMRDEAANAFLKSLEEPPPYVHFMLITSNWQVLLPTIRSRCQRMVFQGLLEADKARILTVHHALSEEDAQRLAWVSFQRLETEMDAWQRFMHEVDQVVGFIECMVDGGHAVDELHARLRDRSGTDGLVQAFSLVLRDLVLRARNLPGHPMFENVETRLDALADRIPVQHLLHNWQEVLRLPALRRLHLNMPIWFNDFGANALGLRQIAESFMRDRVQRLRRKR